MSKTTAEDFDSTAPTILREYLRTFTLPTPPSCPDNDFFLLPALPSSKTHQNSALDVRLESYRNLENIRPLNIPDAEIKKWLNKYARSDKISVKANILDSYRLQHNLRRAGLEAAWGEEISRRTKAPYKGDRLAAQLDNKLYAQRKCDIESMESWLKIALVTVSRVMHFINDNDFNWTITPGVRNQNDQNIFRYCNLPNIVVAYQTPYVLAAREMQEFVECRSFPQIFNPQKKLPLQSQHRLWGKIWDVCFYSKTHWFMLTTYTQWVVGYFSPAWTMGFVSPIFYYDATPDDGGLAILEWLTYWFASAASMEGTRLPPKIFEPIMYPGDVQMDVCRNPTRARSVGARSESNWEGADEEPGSAAGDDFDAYSEVGSVNTQGEPQNGFQRTAEMITPMIQQWKYLNQLPKNTINATRPIDEDDLFDIDAEWPQHVLFQAGRVHGEWMI